jgi:hypothetical protein
MADGGDFDPSDPFDTNYYYTPYENDGAWQKALSQVGSILGKSITQEVGGPLAQIVGGPVGQLEGSQLGWTIDNADRLLQNFQTLLQQLTDWRSYASPLDNPRNNPFGR